jgi:hypothetical protein
MNGKYRSTTLRAIVLAASLLPVGCGGDQRASDDVAANGDAGDARDSVVAATVLTPQPDTALLLTPDGWGPLRIGMSRAEVVVAVGEDAHPELVGGPEPERCDQFRPVGVPEGMLLMLENDTLTRITIMRESAVRTDRGFRIGDSASAILAAYGPAAASSPHKYRDAPSAYITAWTVPPDGPAPARGIVYDIGDDGRVELVHAGGESITYVEGCL